MSKRLQVDLSDEAFEDLARMAGDRSFAEVVRRALNTESFLTSEENNGAKIIIEEPDGTRKEVVRV
jgi:predicted CopG family antitoxin